MFIKLIQHINGNPLDALTKVLSLMHKHFCHPQRNSLMNEERENGNVAAVNDMKLFEMLINLI